MRKRRRPYGHEQFLPHLTPEEREEYDKERNAVLWLRERIAKHEPELRRLELIGRRRGLAKMAIKEAAE